MADKRSFSTAINLLREATDILSTSVIQSSVAVTPTVPPNNSSRSSEPRLTNVPPNGPVSNPVPAQEVQPAGCSSNLHALSATASEREQTVLSEFRSLFAPYRNNSTPSNSSSFSTLQRASRPSTSRRATRPAPYYRVKETWTHEFICLGNPDEKTVPSKLQKLELQSAGLGRKKIVFGNKDGALKLKSTLESFYPKLKFGGGFEILRSGSNNELILIPVPATGYSVPYLRDSSGLGQALAYIRPVQVSLDLSPIEVEEVNY